MTRMGERLSRNALAVRGVATISQQVGRAESGEDTWGPNRCEFHIELQPALSAQAQVRIEAELREVLKGFPGLQTELVTFLGDRISESLSGESAAVTVSIFGSDLDQLDSVAAQVASAVRTVPGAADVKVNAAGGVPTMTIRPNGERLAAFGLRPVEVYDAIAAAYAGTQVAQVYDGNQTQAVRVSLAPNARRDPESIGQLMISTPAGRRVPLAAIADVSLEQSRATVRHESGQRRQVVTANTTAGDVVGFVAAATQTVSEKVKLPSGVFVQFSGEAAGSAAATRDILINSLVATVGIVLMLLLAFSDGRSVALILVNVPFALVGGVAAIALTNATLSIGSLVGLVTLFGISARNSIMLISHYEHLVQVDGMHWNHLTALRGSRERLTPILMTAVVTALGLLPLAIGSGEAGREVEGPMAAVILGGLISSTLLNLFVMPALAHRYLRPATQRGVL
jgi:Cu/Ag efflux pump CusA